MKNAKDNSLKGTQITFLHQRLILKELLAESMVYSVSLKHMRKLDKRRKKEDEAGLKKKKKTTADEQYLKMMNSAPKKQKRNLTQDLRDASGSLVDPSIVP